MMYEIEGVDESWRAGVPPRPPQPDPDRVVTREGVI